MLFRSGGKTVKPNLVEEKKNSVDFCWKAIIYPPIIIRNELGASIHPAHFLKYSFKSTSLSF